MTRSTRNFLWRLVAIIVVVAALAALLVALSAWLLPAPAGAHSWYPESCCRDQHCHPTPCATISAEPDGFVWFDPQTRHDVHFTALQLKLSPDGACHVCFFGWTGVCIFLPRQTS